MTIEEARTILGNKYDNVPASKLEGWINASSGLAEVFMQQMKQQLIKKGVDNGNEN